MAELLQIAFSIQTRVVCMGAEERYPARLQLVASLSPTPRDTAEGRIIPLPMNVSTRIMLQYQQQEEFPVQVLRLAGER